MKILVLNGPNLSRLDLREQKHYGDLDYSQLKKAIEEKAKELSIDIEIKQSDSESEIISWLHEAADKKQPVIFNPAAFTHTSVAIRDALLATKIPFIEVHLSNIHAREAFRKHSYFSDIAIGVICGLGVTGYELAIQAAHQILTERP